MTQNVQLIDGITEKELIPENACTLIALVVGPRILY